MSSSICENVLSGNAMRPTDVVRTAAGLTVEVMNPDAEGRLILADGLWYARRDSATHLVDLATLTGAMRALLDEDRGDAFGRGATGYGVRMLIELATRLSAEATACPATGPVGAVTRDRR